MNQQKTKGISTEICLIFLIFTGIGSFVSILGVFGSFIWLANISPQIKSATHCHAMFDAGSTFYVTTTQYTIFRSFCIMAPVFLCFSVLLGFMFIDRQKNSQAYRGNYREWLVLGGGITSILGFLGAVCLPDVIRIGQNLEEHHPVYIFGITGAFVFCLVAGLALGLKWAHRVNKEPNDN